MPTTIFEYSGMVFEWDSEKETLNREKHKIGFKTAAKVFFDDMSLDDYDDGHSEYEDRYRIIGSVENTLLVLTVAYTMREQETHIRIISARQATSEERRMYYGIDN